MTQKQQLKLETRKSPLVRHQFLSPLQGSLGHLFRFLSPAQETDARARIPSGKLT